MVDPTAPTEIARRDDLMEPFFRAVSIDNSRKGLRLEKIFWRVLEQVAHEENTSVSAIMQSADESQDQSPNLSSFARAYAAIWLKSKLGEAREIASFSHVVGTINACPSPAFLISQDRRLRSYNQPFLRYVRKHIPMEDMEAAPKNLRLQLDISSAELISQLKSDKEIVLNVGFTFGFNERRVRGRLNAVLATCWNEDLVAAYVLE